MNRAFRKIVSQVVVLGLVGMFGLVSVGDDGDDLNKLLDLPAEKKDTVKKPDPKDMKKLEKPADVKEEKPQSSSEELMRRAVFAMRMASERLTGNRDAGVETQRHQKDALNRLDQLIAEAKRQQQQQQQKQKKQQQGKKQDNGTKSQPKAGKKQQQGQQQQQGNKSQQAGNGPKAGQVQDGNRDDVPLSEQLNEWGNLPARVRDQLLQGLEDKFSPIYKDLTEQYYRRLAEESK